MKKILVTFSFASVLLLFALSPDSGFGQASPFPEVGKPNPAASGGPAHGGPAFGPIDMPPTNPAAPHPMTAAPHAATPGNVHQAPQNSASRDHQKLESPRSLHAPNPYARGRAPQRRPSEPLESVLDRNHPFAFYYEIPKDPRAMIKGKPYRVAQLLEGSRNVVTRKKLLQNYWELAGLLVEYNVRIDAENNLRQWAGENGNDPHRPNPMNLAFQLARQQRKSTEIEFVKSQWKLASMLRQTKGETFAEGEMPIPCDFPLYKKYETYAEKIATSERAKYYGHLIPCQEELVSTKSVACKAADNLFQSLPKNAAANGREMISALNQRTDVFLELVDSVVEYNDMVAEYTSETIGPGVSSYRLVGALIELPNFVPHQNERPEREQQPQVATPPPSHFGHHEPRPMPIVAPEPRYASRDAMPQPTFAPEPPPISEAAPTGLTELPMPPKPEIQPVSHVEEKRELEPAPFHAVAPPPAPPTGL